LIKPASILSAVLTLTLALVYSSSAQAFAREFTQDKHPSVFHPENSTAELCLFVYRRQGALMIQPYCMVSVSSQTQAAVSRNRDIKARQR